MKKDDTYHLEAIRYNDRISAVAEELIEETLNPEVRKWCSAVARQHRVHEKLHRAALEKLRKKTAELAGKEQQHG